VAFYAVLYGLVLSDWAEFGQRTEPVSQAVSGLNSQGFEDSQVAQESSRLGY